MDNLLTILNQKMNVDPLLIAVLMTPSLFGIVAKPSCLFTANLESANCNQNEEYHGQITSGTWSHGVTVSFDA